MNETEMTGLLGGDCLYRTRALRASGIKGSETVKRRDEVRMKPLRVS